MKLGWVHPEKANVLFLCSRILYLLRRKLAFQSVVPVSVGSDSESPYPAAQQDSHGGSACSGSCRISGEQRSPVCSAYCFYLGDEKVNSYNICSFFFCQARLFLFYEAIYHSSSFTNNFHSFIQQIPVSLLRMPSTVSRHLEFICE